MKMKAAVTWNVGEPFDKLIKFYPFEEINTAFKESHEGKCIKAVLEM